MGASRHISEDVMRKILFAAVVLILGLSTACHDTYVPPKPQPLSFTGTPYTLKVASISIVEEYRPSSTLPHVEKLSDITPNEAIKEWATSRILAGGTTGRAELVIKDAHIVKRNLPKQKTGIEGYFTEEQTEEYKGALEVELKIYDDQHTLPVASLRVSSKNLRTLGENATVIQRKNLYHEMSVELVKLIEPELERNIQQHFSNYLM